MQLLPKPLDSRSKEVDALVHQFHAISLDLNEFPTHILVILQNTMSQELADHEDILCDHLAKSQNKVASTKA